MEFMKWIDKQIEVLVAGLESVKPDGLISLQVRLNTFKQVKQKLQGLLEQQRKEDEWNQV